VSKLVLTDVSRRFGGVTAVESFSLALAHGEFVSLLGPSGCGKTTTLRMIAGFLAPSDGTIEIYFDDMQKPVMTANDNIFAYGRIGVGTFDDTADWDDITLRGTKVEAKE